MADKVQGSFSHPLENVTCCTLARCRLEAHYGVIPGRFTMWFVFSLCYRIISQATLSCFSGRVTNLQWILLDLHLNFECSGLQVHNCSQGAIHGRLDWHASQANELAQSTMSVGVWVKRLNRMNSELQEGMRGAEEEGKWKRSLHVVWVWSAVLERALWITEPFPLMELHNFLQILLLCPAKILGFKNKHWLPKRIPHF